MITFITGMPGDGKTLYSVRQLLEDLIEREVFIVTNIPLIIPEVIKYVSKRRDDIEKKQGIELVPFNVDERLKVIPDEEVYEFYRHRSGGLVLDWSPDKGTGEDGKKRIPREQFNAAMKEQFLRMNERPDYQSPVHYYIDETHDFFDSREWSACGRSIVFFGSKHRHLHDNIYFITQVMENVEGRLTKLTSETHKVRNFLRRNVGPIKMRPVFKLQMFYGRDTNKKSFNTKEYPLDPAGVAACYKTVGALGVHSKPEQLANKGWLPWWVMIIIGVLIVGAIFGGIFGLPYLGSMYGKHMTEVTLGPMAERAKDAADGEKKKASESAGKPEPSKADEKASEKTNYNTPKEEPIWATGYVLTKGMVNVSMSDGTVRTERDTELKKVERNSITLGAEKIFIRPNRPTDRQRTAEGFTPVQMPQPITSPQPAQSDPLSAWETGPDGVQRLKGTFQIGR